MSTPSTEPTPELPLFPACRRAEPLGPFAVRWQAKREDHDQFLNALTTVNAQLPLSWRLPDELVDDWLAQWVEDVFVGGITCHDRMSSEEARVGVREIAAVVEAVRFVGRYSRLECARRFWFYELERELDWGGFPTADEVAKCEPELHPRRGLEDRPGNESLGTRYDQCQFFSSAAFVATGLAPNALAWLGRLAYRADPHQRLWSAPPRHCVWVRNQFRTAVPALATCLGVAWPPLGDDLPMAELLREVHNWLTDRVGPRFGSGATAGPHPGASPVSTPGPTRRPKKSTIRGEATLKLAAALSAHHGSGAHGSPNQTPIGCNALARMADVAESAASDFFKRVFGGYELYRRHCLNLSGLLRTLANLNGEFSGTGNGD